MYAWFCTFKHRCVKQGFKKERGKKKKEPKGWSMGRGTWLWFGPSSQKWLRSWDTFSAAGPSRRECPGGRRKWHTWSPNRWSRPPALPPCKQEHSPFRNLYDSAVPHYFVPNVYSRNRTLLLRCIWLFSSYKLKFLKHRLIFMCSSLMLCFYKEQLVKSSKKVFVDKKT